MNGTNSRERRVRQSKADVRTEFASILLTRRASPIQTIALTVIPNSVTAPIKKRIPSEYSRKIYTARGAMLRGGADGKEQAGDAQGNRDCEGKRSCFCG